MVNYPNPFKSETNFRFVLTTNQRVTLNVYDMYGREVAVLAKDKLLHAGEHNIPFSSIGLSSGMYIYRLQIANGHFESGNMLIVK